MATVPAASYGHGLSVLTNSCVKQPTRSRSGPATTKSNKVNVIGTKTVNFDDGLPAEMNTANDVRQWAYMSDFDKFETSQPNEMGEDLGCLTNDDFYKRLLQLKNDHKKTLQMCEKLYRQKLAEEGDWYDRCSSEEDVMNGHVLEDLADRHNGAVGDCIDQDLTVELSSKPPVGKHQSLRSRPSSAPARRKNLSRSLDQEEWNLMRKQSMTSETQSEIYDPRESAAAMARIQDMWEHFSVEEYAPRKTKHKRPSSAHSSSPSVDSGKEKEWRYRITIPKPFQMTLREANRDKAKTKTQVLHEQDILQKQQEEEAECQKKFKASPVPAHVYLPLFEEYNEKKEARRRYVKYYRKELLKSIEKPFKFMSREEQKKQRCLEKANLETDSVNCRPKQTFKARPVPDYVYDNSPNEKILENEEYRKIRMKMRAEELMKTASLPPNMEARQKIKEQKMRDQKAKSKRKKRFVPKINGDVPDYDELYRQFQKELQKRKLEREATVTEPFKLHTSKIPSKRDKILHDMERDQESLVESRWPYRNPRTTPRKSFVTSSNMSTSLDSIPHRITSSAELRFHKGRNKARTLSQKDLEELEHRRRQRQKETKLRQSIIERTLMDEQERPPRPSRQEILKEKRESDRARMAEYRQSLEDIKQRVNDRPLLFEQVKQANAKKAAEKRYSQTLRDHGLDETYIQLKSSLSTGVETDADDYDMDETSYTAPKSDDDREASRHTEYVSDENTSK